MALTRNSATWPSGIKENTKEQEGTRRNRKEQKRTCFFKESPSTRAIFRHHACFSNPPPGVIFRPPAENKGINRIIRKYTQIYGINIVFKKISTRVKVRQTKSNRSAPPNPSHWSYASHRPAFRIQHRGIAPPVSGFPLLPSRLRCRMPSRGSTSASAASQFSACLHTRNPA